MITESESLDTWEIDDKFIIIPNGPIKWDKKLYLDSLNATNVKEGFEYSSGKNEKFLSIAEIEEIIAQEKIYD